MAFFWATILGGCHDNKTQWEFNISDLEYLLTIITLVATGAQMMDAQLQHAIGTGLVGLAVILFVHFLYKKMPTVIEIPSIQFGLPKFFIRKLWINHLKPISKFQLWLDGRAEEGMKLYQRKITDKNIQEFIGGPVDGSQREEFNKHYFAWTHQVYGGLVYVFGEKIKKEFDDKLPPEVAIYGGGKKYLLGDIEFLKKKRDDTKTPNL